MSGTTKLNLLDRYHLEAKYWYALYACILNDNLSTSRALFLMGINDYNETKVDSQRGKNKDAHIWTEEEMQQVTELREQKYLWSEIGDIFDVSGSLVCSAFDRHVRKME